MFNVMFPTIRIQIEKWKWNKQYHVWVSNMGNFRDELKHPLPIRIDNISGYCSIITPFGVRTAQRLVLTTWKPVSGAADLTIDHLDHNKRNNSLDNLEWITRKGNQQQAKDDLVVLNEPLEEIPKPIPVVSRFSLQEGYKIVYGKISFDSLSEAINYVMKDRGIINATEATCARITNSIGKSITRKTKYCGEIWQLQKI